MISTLFSNAKLRLSGIMSTSRRLWGGVLQKLREPDPVYLRHAAGVVDKILRQAMFTSPVQGRRRELREHN
jgi:hypothetical protein